MKVLKNKNGKKENHSDGSIKLFEPVIAIGTRGTAALTTKVLPPGVVFGENQQLPKSGTDENTAPWLIVRSWISVRPQPFTLYPLSQAIKKGAVKLVKNVTVTQRLTGRKFKADAVMPKGWQPNQKVPQNVAVVNTTFPGGRVETKYVNENKKADGTRPKPRNAQYVGDIVFSVNGK